MIRCSRFSVCSHDSSLISRSAATIQDGPEPFDVTVREVHGDEKATWWERAVEAWPDYAEYQKKTDRQIPVFVLTPVS